MKKRKQQSLSIFSWLTLLKQDIRELIQIFQGHLQNVEITIDEFPIVDRTELEQFDESYRASFLIARGFGYELGEEDARGQEERPSIELKMNKESATLLVRNWTNVGNAEAEALAQIRKVLWRCHNRTHQFLQIVVVGIFLGPPLSLLPILQQHHVVFILRVIFAVGAGILLIPITFLLFRVILRLFHMETHVFLFPGKTGATRVYGRYEAVGRLVVALILLVVLDACLLVAFRIFWR